MLTSSIGTWAWSSTTETSGEILAPQYNLVGECGHTKVTKANKTKKKPWHWDPDHQQAFVTVKATIAFDVTLAYPDYSHGFETYTDSQI